MSAATWLISAGELCCKRRLLRCWLNWNISELRRRTELLLQHRRNCHTKACRCTATRLCRTAVARCTAMCTTARRFGWNRSGLNTHTRCGRPWRRPCAFLLTGCSAQQNTLQLIGVCVCVRWVFFTGSHWGQNFTSNDSLHWLARITGAGPDNSSTPVRLLSHCTCRFSSEVFFHRSSQKLHPARTKCTEQHVVGIFSDSPAPHTKSSGKTRRGSFYRNTHNSYAEPEFKNCTDFPVIDRRTEQFSRLKLHRTAAELFRDRYRICDQNKPRNVIGCFTFGQVRELLSLPELLSSSLFSQTFCHIVQV